MKPRVTIGLPFRDAASTLGETLRSVFAQTFDDWELILVDDGSTDASLRIARSVRDRRVRVITDGRCLALGARLNQLALEARAPLLARMDADDLMYPERLRVQAGAMEADPALDVTGSAAVVIDGLGRPRGLRGTRQSVAADEVLRGGLFVHPTVMFRTQWARENPYSTEYPRAEDFELWVRTCGSIAVQLLPHALLLYREIAPLRLEAYVDTQRSRRAVLRSHGPRLVGARRTAQLLALTVLAEAATRTAARCGWDEPLLRRRNQPLTAEERGAARAALARIRATDVPGLDGDAAIDLLDLGA